jgi:hypothetical protein
MYVVALTGDRVPRTAMGPFEQQRAPPQLLRRSYADENGNPLPNRDRKPNGGFSQACGKPILYPG